MDTVFLFLSRHSVAAGLGALICLFLVRWAYRASLKRARQHRVRELLDVTDTAFAPQQR